MPRLNVIKLGGDPYLKPGFGVTSSDSSDFRSFLTGFEELLDF